MTGPRAFLAGRVERTARLTARNGTSYLAIAVATTDSETKAYVFNRRVIEQIEKLLHVGDEAAFCGPAWTPRGRSGGIVVDGVLTAKGPRIPDRRDKRDQQEEASIEQLALI